MGRCGEVARGGAGIKLFKRKIGRFRIKVFLGVGWEFSGAVLSAPAFFTAVLLFQKTFIL